MSITKGDKVICRINGLQGVVHSSYYECYRNWLGRETGAERIIEIKTDDGETYSAPAVYLKKIE